MKARLSTLWLFATLNYLYCDVVTLMNPTLLRKFLAGDMGSFRVTQGFLLASAVLVEIPMVMVLLSRILPQRAARIANLVAGVVMTVVQGLSLVVQTPPPYYVFFSTFEIAATLVIVSFAWRWNSTAQSTTT